MSWPFISTGINRIKSSYLKGFLDVNHGNIIVRNDNTTNLTVNNSLKVFNFSTLHNPSYSTFTIDCSGIYLYSDPTTYISVNKTELGYLNGTTANIQESLTVYDNKTMYIDSNTYSGNTMLEITTASVQKMNTLLLSLGSQVAEQDAEQTELLQSLSQCQQTTQTILSQQKQMNQTLNSQTDQINSILVKLGGTAGSPLPQP